MSNTEYAELVRFGELIEHLAARRWSKVIRAEDAMNAITTLLSENERLHRELAEAKKRLEELGDF